MTSRISDLASTIQSNTAKVDKYLHDNGLPVPSFDVGGPLHLGITSPEIETARGVAIDASFELLDLLQGPLTCMFPNYNATSLHAIYKFDIAKKVPLSGMISFQDLAEQCSLHEQDLRRIIRFAIVFHRLFNEPQKGFVSHSAGSLKLAQDPFIHAGLGQAYQEFYGSYARTVDAMIQFKDREPNETGFALAHNTNQSMFQYLSSRPVEAEQFSNAMKSFSSSVRGNSESFLVQGYPWSSLGNGTVVDVGGSNGYVSISLASMYPELKFIVQDRPEVIESAGSKTPAALKDRVNFESYDFFTPQRVVADAYLYRWVFHDWPDAYVKRILRQMIPVLKTGARVIINESLCPEPGSLPLNMERQVRFIDMIMLTTNNSRLRDRDEWQQIFQDVDTRFGPVSCWVPEGSALAIMEVVWHG